MEDIDINIIEDKKEYIENGYVLENKVFFNYENISNLINDKIKEKNKQNKDNSKEESNILNIKEIKKN